MKENPNVEWIKRRKELLENIKGFGIKGDRIQITTQLSYIHSSMYESMVGWQNWINGWISIELNKKINVADSNVLILSDIELKDLHEKFKDFATKFIELDIKFTEIVTKKMNKKKLKEFQQGLDDNMKRMIV
jgi:hypothetical protein